MSLLYILSRRGKQAASSVGQRAELDNHSQSLASCDKSVGWEVTIRISGLLFLSRNSLEFAGLVADRSNLQPLHHYGIS
jgi:hypothetical protein